MARTAFVLFRRKLHTTPKSRIRDQAFGRKKASTLQAQKRILPDCSKLICKNEACRSSQKTCSLTVEAALCLPLFLFTALMLLAPMKMLDSRRQLQNTMEAAAKDMALAAYVENLMEEGGEGLINRAGAAGDALSDIAGGITDGLNTGFTAARVLASLDQKLYQNPYFETCDILKDDMIEMELHYELRLPFEIFGIDGIPMSSVVHRRAWTGSEGGRGAENYGAGGGAETPADGFDRDEDGDRVVYVGKTSTVYHKDRHCHYLDNVLQKVPGETVGELRNASGGKYHA